MTKLLIIVYLLHFRQVKFHSGSAGSSGLKRVAEEEIIEVEDLAAKQSKPSIDTEKKSTQFSIGSFKKPQTNRIGLGPKSSLANLVKRKPITSTSTATSATATNNASVAATATVANKPSPSPTSAPLQPAAKAASTTNALSLLGGYDSNSDSD